MRIRIPTTFISWLLLVSVACAQGPAVTRLTNIINSYPHPSPDGQRVVFQSDRTGTPQVHVMDSDGGNISRLTDGPLGAETPKWSPDGERIFACQNVETADYEYGDVVVIALGDEGPCPSDPSRYSLRRERDLEFHVT